MRTRCLPRQLKRFSRQSTLTKFQIVLFLNLFFSLFYVLKISFKGGFFSESAICFSSSGQFFGMFFFEIWRSEKISSHFLKKSHLQEVNVALSKHINEILDFSFHNFFSCFFIVLCTENIVFQVAIRYQPFGVKNNLDFTIEVNIFTYKKVSYYFNGHSDIERGKNLLLKLSKVDPIFLEILLFSRYLVKYTIFIYIFMLTL